MLIDELIQNIDTFGGNGHAEAKIGSEFFQLTLRVNHEAESFSGTILRFSEPVNVKDCNALSFTARGRMGNEVFEIKLKEAGDIGAYEEMVLSRNLFDIGDTWNRFSLPLSKFQRVQNSTIEFITIAANGKYSPELQIIEIKDIEFNNVDKFQLRKPEVFIVHGHDEEMKNETKDTLTQLGLSPIVLNETQSGLTAIIESLENYSDLGYAVVLFSPDDEGYKRGHPEEKMLRARQNVIMELGYFAGKLGRGRISVIFKDEKGFEIPSNFSGVLYIPYDSQGQWRYTVAKELTSVGYDLNLTNLDNQK